MISDELQQFEYMKKKFQEMIAAYDALSMHTKQFQIDLSKVSSANDKIITTQLEQANSISTMSDHIARSIAAQNEQNRALKQENVQSTDTQRKNISEMAEMKAKINEISNESTTCKAALQSKVAYSDVQPIRASIEHLSQYVNESYKDLQERNSKINSEISIFKQLLSEITRKISTIPQKDAENSENFLKLASEIKVLHQKIQSVLDQGNLLYRYVDDKVLSIPKPPVQSAEDIKKMMLAAFEPFAIDAKNANLRSSNNENKLTVLEKKLEHLSLILTAMKQG